jgi:hypothetical protein
VPCHCHYLIATEYSERQCVAECRMSCPCSLPESNSPWCGLSATELVSNAGSVACRVHRIRPRPPAPPPAAEKAWPTPELGSSGLPPMGPPPPTPAYGSELDPAWGARSTTSGHDQSPPQRPQHESENGSCRKLSNALLRRRDGARCRAMNSHDKRAFGKSHAHSVDIGVPARVTALNKLVQRRTVSSGKLGTKADANCAISC